MGRILIGGCLVFFAATLLADETEDACRMCHRDALTLGSWEAEALAARLKDMRDGRAEHPVPLPELDDDALEALASALAEDQ